MLTTCIKVEDDLSVMLTDDSCPLRSLLSIRVWTAVLPCSAASFRLTSQVR